VSLGFAARQDGTTRTQLQLAAARAIFTDLNHLISEHGVDGAREIISSRLRTAQLSQQLITELLTAGRKMLESKTKTGATSLADNFASSVTSLRYRLPSLSLYGRGTPSPTPNPFPSAPAEGPTASGQSNEEEQSMHAQLEEEPSVPWTSDGTLPNFEPGEALEEVFTIVGDSEINFDEPRESTTVQMDDTEIYANELEERTIIQMDDTETSNDGLEESTIVQMDGTETNNIELEENAIVWRDVTEVYSPELEESTLVWSNERAKVLVSFDLFPILHSEELF
jgi:hypothetical protein